MNQRNCLALLLLLLCVVSLSAQSQEKRITVSFTGISLSEAMRRIEKSTGYTFFYDATQVRVEQKVNLVCKNELLSVALDKMLGSIHLSFEITNTQIAVFNKQGVVTRTNIKVHGKVSCEEGEEIVGANVIIEGTNKGTITDLDGRFELETLLMQFLLSLS